jgi:hypothetical protein
VTVIAGTTQDAVYVRWHMYVGLQSSGMRHIGEGKVGSPNELRGHEQHD